MVIAIDGPAGAGKSTVARALAVRLGFTYMDSGAMYRAVGLLRLNAPTVAPAELASVARIEFVAVHPRAAEGEPGAPAVLLDGRDVTTEIRTPEVSEAASQVASDPGVRAAMVALQRRLIASGDWVVEGRDIGTVVAPDADLKLFLTADPGERARRRSNQSGATIAAVESELRVRDTRDSERVHSPLSEAPDAVKLDTTGLSIDDVLDEISKLVGR